MDTSKFSSKFLWIEKYRVKDIDKLVLDENVKQEMKFYLSSPTDLPNMILVGNTGTGKTTLARIIIETLITDMNNVLILNGSDQRGIDIVRKTITEFIKSEPYDDPIKIVFIDEADYLTQEAWAALRNLIEKYYRYTRFIFTGNQDNFPIPIKSRSILIKFKNLDRNYIISYLSYILQSENINYKEEDLNKIIDVYYPDVRTMISALQRYSFTGTLNVDLLNDDKSKELELTELTLNLIELIKSNVNPYQIVISINKICMESLVDYREVFKMLFYRLNINDIPIKVLVYKYSNQLNYALVPGMLYISFIDELKSTIYNMQSLNTY
ncbi:MAG: AAA family ATPase [Candidatus Micrarchaeaceae archaeon]